MIQRGRRDYDLCRPGGSATRIRTSRRAALLLVLGLALAFRSVNLRAPILEEHSWRQADTAAMACNFFENGYRLLHPQIDWGGATGGEVESEFPIYQFLVALLYGLCGVSESWGRALSLAFSLLTVVYLRRLASLHTDPTTALLYGRPRSSRSFR